MKTKKIVALIVCIGMLASPMVQNVTSADERIKYALPVTSYNTIEETATVTYTLTETPTDTGATLIAAYIHPVSHRILSINASICVDVSEITVAPKQISVTLPNKSSEGGVLHHYLWHALDDVVTIEDFSPSSVGSLNGSLTPGAEQSSATLSWDASVDDWNTSDNIIYNIYDHGYFLGTTPAGTTSHRIDSLRWGGKYLFEVAASDEGYAESVRESIEVVAKRTHTSELTSEDCHIPGDSAVEILNALAASSYEVNYVGKKNKSTYHDYTYMPDIGGLPCISSSRKVTSGLPTTDSTRHAFGFNPSFVTDANNYIATSVDSNNNGLKDAKFAVELEYYDKTGPTSFNFEVVTPGANAGESTWKGVAAGTHATTQTNSWQTLRTYVTIEGGIFPDGRDYGVHMRIHTNRSNGSNGLELEIRKFTIMPLDDYNAIPGVRDAWLDVQQAAIGRGLKVNNPTDTTLNDGRYGILANDTTGLSVSLVESGGTLVNATEIEVMYYVPENTNVDTFTIHNAEVPITAKGKWQKAKVMRNNADWSTDRSIVISGGVYVNNVRIVEALSELQ